MAVLCHGSLTLKHLYRDSLLVVCVCCESLRLLGGDDGVPANQFSHHSANRFDAQSQRGHVQNHHRVLFLATQNASLYCGTICNRLVGVHTSVGLLVIEEVLEKLLDFGNSSGSSHQYNLIHVCLLQTGITEYLLDRAKSFLEEISTELFESGTSEGLREVNTIVKSLHLNTDLSL
mmetsp:Transcript_28250/g.45750  ORF Transcript_28250/g.45750 Transcript_28250/m.45750 type:complete len:176 (-) Transcript_28250:1052-1579(-)